jgi:hypothetical protein
VGPAGPGFPEARGLPGTVARKVAVAPRGLQRGVTIREVST